MDRDNGGITIDVPSGFEKFHKLIGKLTDKHDLARVFDDWLEYIIHAHTIGEAPEWDKPYSKDEITVLWDMYCELILTLNERLVTDKDWFDYPGVYYESCISTPYQREKAGQFFTPQDVCNLMASLNMATLPEEGHIRINDPTSGSGRCLLAAHVQRPGAYMVAEDLDHTCVLMAVVNFLLHGVNGLVVWHNTLTGDFYGAWRVNESMNMTGGAPHCRVLTEEEYNSQKMMDEILMSDTARGDVTILKPDKQSTLEGIFG